MDIKKENEELINDKSDKNEKEEEINKNEKKKSRINVNSLKVEELKNELKKEM